jgi:DNA repair exonuclease SbcCD nuclease subunit
LKVAFIGDLHFRLQTPISRTEEDFWSALERKMRWLGKTCAERDIHYIISTGDLLDPRPASIPLIHKAANLLQEISDTYKLQLFTVQGNHDLHYHTTTEYTGLSLLARIGAINILDASTPLEFNTFNIIGVSYDAEIPSKSNKYTILVLHEMILPPTVSLPVKTFDIDRVKNFDLVICGHYHEPFQYKNIINPGVFIRTRWEEKDYSPKVVIFDSDHNRTDLLSVPVNPSNISFVHRKIKTTDEKFDNKLDAFIGHISALTPKNYNSKDWISSEILAIQNRDLKQLLKKYYEEADKT